MALQAEDHNPSLGVVILQWIHPTPAGHVLSLLAMLVLGVLAWQKPARKLW